MDKEVFLIAFLFPFIAFAFLGYLVVHYKQKPRPFFYILTIFIVLNVLHFKYGIKSVNAGLIWLLCINIEALKNIQF